MHKMRMRVILGLIIVFLIPLSGTSVTGETVDPLYVHFIDVGQGDAILIDYGENEILIDGGPNDSWVPYLAGYVDGALELVIVTHPHADHIGGLPTVFSNYQVDELWTSGATHTTAAYDQYWAAVSSSGAVITTVRCGYSSDSLGVLLEVLNPCELSSDLNNTSIVVKLTHGEDTFLFTGDAEIESEQAMLRRGVLSEVDALKVGHHGSSSSTSAGFLDIVQPSIAVISVGEGNRYGHPTSETLGALVSHDIDVYQTRLHGTVIIESNGKRGIEAITWEDADEHIGETLWVYGPVGSVTRMDYGRVFINIPKAYPNHEFTILIDEDYTEAFDERYGSRFEDKLVGETVCVHGEIIRYDGTTEALPSSPDQIRSAALNADCPDTESAGLTVKTENAVVNATASSGGTISPSGVSIATIGSSMTFEMSGSLIDVLVDGSSVGVLGTYTFSNITGDHTIHAEFESAIPPPPFITLVSYPESVQRGLTAEVVIETCPFTVCELSYRTPSGAPSGAVGLGVTTSSADGIARWSWLIGGNTNPGTGTLYIKAYFGETQLQEILSFEIYPKE